MSKKKSPLNSPLKRSLKLFGAAAKLAQKEIGTKVSSSLLKKLDEKSPEAIKLRVEQAKILTDNLGQLKGAAMKVGQMISTEASDFLPQQALDVLSKLQSDAPKVDFDLMYDQIISDLGEEKFNSLKSFNKEPIAAASIGQVYEAVTADGREVVLKVQYPGVAESIHSDINILRKVVEPILKVSGRKMDLDEIFSEIANTLSLETDYENEMRATQKYRELSSPYDQFVVPEVVEEFCGKRVLCTSKVKGQLISDWIKTNPSKEDRTFIGSAVLDLFIKEFYEWGFVQTDPNFGNYFVQTDPLRLVLLDFGSTKEYSQKFIENYKNLLRTMKTNDRKKIIESFFEADMFDLRESEDAQKKFVRMLKTSVDPFDPSRQPFNFADENYSLETRQSVKEFAASLKFTPPPKKLIFLHRKLGGVFNLLKNLEVEIDLVPYWPA